MANFSGDRKYETYNQLFCSEETLTGISEELTFFAVLNIPLSVTAFLGNILIQVALHKESSLHPPTKLLLRSLSVSDLCVGLISEPITVIAWFSAVKEHSDFCRYALNSSVITTFTLGTVSLLTLIAISVDRRFALLLGLRYRQVVTLKRTRMNVIAIWIISIIAPSVYFLNSHLTLWCGNIGILICLVISTICYTKIFLNLRYHHTQVQDHVHHGQVSQANQLNIARYRKAVYSALWLQLTLVACYLPQSITGTLLINREFSPSLFLALCFTSTLVYFNSSLNPILYCWKIREVRQAVKDTIRHLCCPSPSQ